MANDGIHVAQGKDHLGGGVLVNAVTNLQVP